MLPGCFTQQFEAGYGRIREDVPGIGVYKTFISQGVRVESPGTINPTLSKTGCWGFKSLRSWQFVDML